jgi:predicted TIM-barrel fold metal-dependent hydrolase
MPEDDELPRRDEELPAFLARLGLPGIFDTHVHFMPDRLEKAVWAHFDELASGWPIRYRSSEEERLRLLPRIGVRRHTALAYAHRPGVAQWLNQYTLGLAARHPQVVPTFTFYPEPEAGRYVAEAIAAGGACVKVHLQVGKFDALHPQLTEAWSAVERAGIPVVLHAGAVADGSGGEEWCGVTPVRRLLEAFPGLRLVLAHLGVPHTAEFLALAEDHSELRFDTAMAVTDTVQIWTPPRWLAGRLGVLPGRVLFGSDFPSIPHTVADQVAALARLGLGDDWLRGVLWHNAARLFGPERPGPGMGRRPIGHRSLKALTDKGDTVSDNDDDDDDLVGYVARHSPRPEADVDTVERLLEEAPPAEAEEEVQKMVDGFRSGGGAATGKRSAPVDEPPPGLPGTSPTPGEETPPER